MSKLKAFISRLSPLSRRLTILTWLGYALSCGADLLDVTFGRADWFQPRQGWSPPRAANWRGRVYLIAWGIVIFVPSILLMTRGSSPEATIWLASSLALFGGDLRRTLAQPQSPETCPSIEVAAPVDPGVDAAVARSA